MDGRYAVMRVKGTKRTALGSLLMSVLLIVPIALRAVAAPNDGVGSTSLSLISLTINGQTVDVAFGEGTATNEIAVSSEVGFTAAAVSVDGVISTSAGNASASADSTTPYDSDADATVPFHIPDGAEGSVTFEGVVAEVDESARSARSTLGQATLDADVADSFVGLTGVSIGNLQEVTTSTASASEGISISNLFLVPLRKFLERLTTLSADDLIAFAEAVGGDYTADELATVEAERQEAISEINAILAPLSGLGVSPLPADASVQEILDYAAACSSDPLLEPVCDSIEAAVSDLRDAVEALNTAVGELPLISINTLNAGVSAETDDTSSSATSELSWEDAQVAGKIILQEEDYEKAMSLLIESVDAVEAALQQLPGFEELSIDVIPLVLSTSTTPVGSRQAASSSLNFLHVTIDIPESTNVPAPLVASLNVMAMGADAEHEPGETEEPPPDNNPPVAVDDEATTPQDTPVDISVLPNDSDPDGDEITVVDYTQPSNGTVTCTSDGTCTYTPDPGFTGTDSFDYTITDPFGEESTATVTITIGGGSSGGTGGTGDTGDSGGSGSGTGDSVYEDEESGSVGGVADATEVLGDAANAANGLLNQGAGNPENSGANPNVQGPGTGPLGPPGTQGNPGNPGITSQSTSACDPNCSLAATGFDLKYSFVGLMLIAAGFALCRSLRGFA